MNGLFEAGLEIQRFLRERNWQFCVIGGLAVARWGRPRATQDVDVSLLTGLGREEQFVDPLLGAFPARIADARQFALENRVVLASASNGVPLDITLAAFPYEERVIARASSFEFASGVALVTASAEDLIVLKAFAARDQDWADVEGIVVRQSKAIDWECVINELTSLCELKEETDSLDRLQAIRQRETQ